MRVFIYVLYYIMSMFEGKFTYIFIINLFLKVFECEPCSTAGWCKGVVTIFLPTIATQTFFWLFAQLNLGYSGKRSVAFCFSKGVNFFITFLGDLYYTCNFCFH